MACHGERCEEIAAYWGRDTDPHCFACGYNDATWAQFECAHVIARSIGGGVEPGNMAVLCKRCHIESPMTNRPEIFWSWVNTREDYFVAMGHAIAQELGRHGLTAWDAIDLEASTFKDYLRSVQLDAHPCKPILSYSVLIAMAAALIKESISSTIPSPS